MFEEKKRRQKENEKAGLNFDFGVGQLNFGGLFQGLEKLMDLASDLKKEGGELKKEGEIDLGRLKNGMKGIFGITIKTAAGGESVVEPFGNIKKSPEGTVVVESQREPLTDLFDEKDEIVVLAEIPGIEKEGIALSLKGDILDISAVGKNRSYHKEMLLPIFVKQENIAFTYHNGILEIRIKK